MGPCLSYVVVGPFNRRNAIGIGMLRQMTQSRAPSLHYKQLELLDSKLTSHAPERVYVTIYSEYSHYEH